MGRSESNFSSILLLRRGFLALILAALALALSGCARNLWTRPVTVEPSFAYPNPELTTLGHIFADDLREHPGKSGFALIYRSDRAFQIRNSLLFAAEKTLDLQYFIWETDASGRILAHSLLQAADRGVRVRILVDDLHTGGKEMGIAALDRHPNIEVRLFNPFAARNGRASQLVMAFARLNNRMHNKTFIADNAIAIVGGRNIGDVYFGVDAAANFRDLDLAAAGPVVGEISASFDLFWNSEWAVPAESLLGSAHANEQILETSDKLKTWVSELKNFPYPLVPSGDDFPERVNELRSRFVWGEGKVLFDLPDKIAGDNRNRLRQSLVQEAMGIRQEMLVEAAYLVPSRADLRLVDRLRARGVKIRVLTNSLATNDVAAAHAGYAKYRRALLNKGVELYELRPDAGSDRDNWSALAGNSQASLHTKGLVVDRQELFIGSFNFDPRSNNINTEIGLYVNSPELAAQVATYMDEGVKLENCYRLMLEKDEVENVDRLVWVTRDEAGREIRYYSEPGATWWKRFVSGVIELLPIEGQL